MNTAQKTAFVDALGRAEPILLDGGLATQLEAQGCDINNALWSASVLLNDPQEIVVASRAYLDAGAQCIATASYQASREGFAQSGLNATDADALMLRSIELARQARREFLTDNDNCEYAPMIAASIGPYGAMLHDGSEYTGVYAANAGQVRAFHEQRLALFDNSDVDILALETIPAMAEAEVLSDLLRGCNTPAWVSFSCRDGRHISDGTPIAEAARLYRDHPTVLAVGINCTPPQYTLSLIEEIQRAVPNIAILAYPNSGESYNVTDGSWSGTVAPIECAAAAKDWIAAGAKLVGGCCRMGPEHIRAMSGNIRGNN